MRIFIIAIISVCFFSSCKKEFSEQFYPYENNSINDTSWRRTVGSNDPVTEITNNLIDGNTIFIDSFNVATGGIIAFSDSLKISFPAHACVGSGSTLSGNIKVELTQLKKKGDFIRYAKPTTSFDKLLQTGGSFNVKLSQNGHPVFLAQNTSYKITYSNPAPSADMRFFYEDLFITNNDSLITWTQDQPNNPPSGSIANWQLFDSSTNTLKKGYEITSKKLNWINCDFFNDSLQAATRVNVSLPLNFTNGNTQAYVVFKNKNIIARLNADVAAKVFFFNKIPTNSEVIFITISKLGNDYYLGTKNTTVQNANIIGVNPEQKSLTYINNYLNSL